MIKKILVCSDHYQHPWWPVYAGPSMILSPYHYKRLMARWLFPVVIPPIALEDDQYEQLLDESAWVLFFGWKDIDPVHYGEDIQHPVQRYTYRDRIEMKLAQLAAAKDVPIFGICRWMQLINVAFGGSLYQDITAQGAWTLVHMLDPQHDYNALAHRVTTIWSTYLDDAVGTQSFYTNSFHHQSIKTLWSWLNSIATSADWVIEAIQHTSKNIRWVQRHPEVWTDYSPESQHLLDRVFTTYFTR